jgi:hypothetical protein
MRESISRDCNAARKLLHLEKEYANEAQRAEKGEASQAAGKEMVPVETCEDDCETRRTLNSSFNQDEITSGKHDDKVRYGQIPGIHHAVPVYLQNNHIISPCENRGRLM